MSNLSTSVLPTIELTNVAGVEPRWSVIWLHGLGADGHDFEPVVPELRLAEPARFVFPHAPIRPVTINGGLRMRAWYDIVSFDRRAGEDEPGIRDSAAAVERLIDREIDRGLAADRIVLAGFSQGGAIALHTALRQTRRLGGLVSLSAYLPLAESLAAEQTSANAALPLFMAHGTLDPVVPFAFGEASRQQLVAAGYHVDWHHYPMGHTVSIEEIRDLGQWMRDLTA